MQRVCIFDFSFAINLLVWSDRGILIHNINSFLLLIKASTYFAHYLPAGRRRQFAGASLSGGAGVRQAACSGSRCHSGNWPALRAETD